MKAELAKLTLQTFVEKFVKKELNMAEPSVEAKGALVYEMGEGLEEDEAEMYHANLKKTFSDFGIKDKDVVSIEVIF